MATNAMTILREIALIRSAPIDEAIKKKLLQEAETKLREATGMPLSTAAQEPAGSPKPGK